MSAYHGTVETIRVALPANAFDSYGRNGYFRLAEVEVFQASSGEIMLSGYSKRRGDREPARLTLDARAARLLAASLTALVGAKCATIDCSNLVEAASTSPYCPDCNGLVPA